MPTFSRFRSRAFQPLNKKRERQREKGVGSLALPTRASHRCHPFIAWSNSRQSSPLPVNHPEAISLMHPRSPPPSHHIRVNNTPILCASRRARFLSKWIHDEFLFRGLNARGSRLDFPFRSRSITPCHRRPRPLTAALSHFLVSRWDTQPCWMSRCRRVWARWLDF